MLQVFIESILRNFEMIQDYRNLIVTVSINILPKISVKNGRVYVFDKVIYGKTSDGEGPVLKDILPTYDPLGVFFDTDGELKNGSIKNFDKEMIFRDGKIVQYYLRTGGARFEWSEHRWKKVILRRW